MWAGYSREMICWLFCRFILWIVNIKISPNEKPWKINAWNWISLWWLFNLSLVHHVHFPLPGSGMRPNFCSVSASKTTEIGNIRKVSLPSSWPGCLAGQATAGSEAAAQPYGVNGKKNAPALKVNYKGRFKVRTRRSTTPLQFSKYFQGCFKLFNKCLVMCTMYRAMFLFYFICIVIALHFLVVFTAIAYAERKLRHAFYRIPCKCMFMALLQC